ncbi:MAG: hypothetical protein JWM00_227 [Candidatus Saccharibacteria bacterium]|nr:hypothetical protein [Candidatus Saccharibacteria bacterium]
MNNICPVMFASSLTALAKRLRAAPDVESRRRIGLGLQMFVNASKRAARLRTTRNA